MRDVVSKQIFRLYQFKHISLCTAGSAKSIFPGLPCIKFGREPIAKQFHTTVRRNLQHTSKPQSTEIWKAFKEEGSSGSGNRRRGYVLIGTSVLAVSPIALAAEIRPKDHQNVEDQDQTTTELRMLQVSDQEYEDSRSIPKDASWLRRFFKTIQYTLRDWIWEPVATGVRFVHLAAIFIPVIVLVPLVWIGGRLPHKDHERSGTIWWYGFLIRSMERAGPTFIKLGQWAASRSDIFPIEMCKMMSSLHSNAVAHPLSDTKRIVEQAFNGRPFNTTFDEFDEKPLGVGAIAQVYRAKLNSELRPPSLKGADTSSKGVPGLRNKVDAFVKSTPPKVPSTWVAIKVRHPHVDRMVHRDLQIMGFFARLINAVPTLEWLSMPDEVKQFGEMMRLQLDLRIEAANLTKFRENFKYRNTCAFPVPYTEYTTRQVLIEEFAHGIPLHSFLEAGGGPFQHEIADMGLDAFLHMLLIDNFAHADLHPGNIMVRFYRPQAVGIFSEFQFPFFTPPSDEPLAPNEPDEILEITEQVLSRLRPYKDNPARWQQELEQLDAEGYRPQLIFIDTGLVTELSPINRKNFLDLFTAVAEFDGYRAGRLMIERCRQPDAVINNEIFCLRMQHLVLGVKGKTFALGNIKIGDVLAEVLDMIRGHHVRLEGDFINVVLSILLLEGIGRRLDPNLDLFKSALPILRQLGASSGSSMLRKGDVSMVKVWLGLEIREFLTSSVHDVENCVKYDLLSPNI